MRCFAMAQAHSRVAPLEPIPPIRQEVTCMTTKRSSPPFPLIALVALAACVPARRADAGSRASPRTRTGPTPAAARAGADHSATGPTRRRRPGTGATRPAPRASASLAAKCCSRCAAIAPPARSRSRVRASRQRRRLSCAPKRWSAAWRAGAVAGPVPAIAARVAANDPLLDAMAFSKGRFAVEVAGLPTLYVPSYPEVTRVIEDCR